MRLSPRERGEIIAEVFQYARTRRPGRLIRRLMGRLGPVGELFSVLLDTLSGQRRLSQAEVEQAIDAVIGQGFGIPEPPAPPVQPGPIRPVAPAGPQAPPVTTSRTRRPEPEPPGQPQPAAAPSPQKPAQPDVWPEEHLVDTRRVWEPSEHERAIGSDLGPEIETPQSSNVFSFRYDFGQGILYVCYKAAGKTVSSRDAISSCTGKTYKIGHRPHVRGPTYAYGGAKRPVPRSVYERMISAKSKGRFVWNQLRVCGSLWGHQYVYRLVAGSPGQGKRGQPYIPRKATPKGFRVRTVPLVGQGRRPARKSTLPERMF